MALAATFSALEVVPLTLLTLDAWDFVTLTRAQCDVGAGVVPAVIAAALTYRSVRRASLSNPVRSWYYRPGCTLKPAAA